MSFDVFCFFVQSDADYWLLTDAADVSITDMWRTERILIFVMLPLLYNFLFATNERFTDRVKLGCQVLNFS